MRPVFNRNTLESWQEVDPRNWRATVEEMIQLFFEIGPEQFADIKNAWRVGDLKSLKRAAHSLKSSCGNVGAERAHDLLNALENDPDLSTREIAARMQELEVCFAATTRELRHYRVTNRAA